VKAMPTHPDPVIWVSKIMIENNEFSYHGKAETKYAEHKNHKLATCNAASIVGKELSLEITVRMLPLP